MTFVSVQVALDLGIAVGADPRVAMTVPGRVVFLADRPWDEACTREASAMVDWQGDSLVVPPFELRAL